ncbi:MAG: hypothetical protein K2X38_13395, partial [Gemmataceae bacterium]|nr:hypothetical protein [Gemmataceae bacterium]
NRLLRARLLRNQKPQTGSDFLQVASGSLERIRNRSATAAERFRCGEELALGRPGFRAEAGDR